MTPEEITALEAELCQALGIEQSRHYRHPSGLKFDPPPGDLFPPALGEGWRESFAFPSIATDNAAAITLAWPRLAERGYQIVHVHKGAEYVTIYAPEVGKPDGRFWSSGGQSSFALALCLAAREALRA